MSQLKRVLLVHTDYPENILSIVEQVGHCLKEKNIEYDIHLRQKMEFHKDQCLIPHQAHKEKPYDLIFAIGGDGTFLYAARTFLSWDLPVMGINAGRLGYLMEINPEDIGDALDRLSRGDYHRSQRMILEATVTRKGQQLSCFQALNDVVITRGAIARMIEISITVEGQVLSHYRADGAIVSTPTGSTAYNLSSGGPILAPDVDALVITPICPHTLGVRPVVLGSDQVLTFTVLTREANTILAIDGQEGLDLISGDEVHIRQSDHKITLYRLDKADFFSTLRKKLGWHS